MEELKPNVQTPLQNLAPSAPPTASRKRSFDNTNVNFEDSNYFKMRALLKDIRPHFLEVLRTPEFEKCKAAQDINDKMKTFMNLYKEMTAETISLTKCQNVTGQIQDDRKPKEQHTNYVKSEEKPSVVIPSLFDDISKKNSYIVGGSAFGWNFITFTSSEAIYYGRTKEAFRAANVVPK